MKLAITQIVIVTTLLTTAAIFPLQGIANEESQVHYEMVVVGNQASGTLVRKGDYQLALDRINGRYTGNPFANATNACVAHNMLGQYDQAEPYCDEAIRLANKSPKPAPKGWKGRNQLATQRSLAYSNRGVMRILRGDASGAEEDFRMAIERKPELRAPTQNLARTRIETTGPAVAQVSH